MKILKNSFKTKNLLKVFDNMIPVAVQSYALK